MGVKIKNKKQSFLEGAAILIIATGLVKVIGAIFKIPLGNLIGEMGMGYFQNAYDLYLPIYSLAMAGFPIAVSRMVAENVANQRYRDTRTVLRVARKVFFVSGLVGFALMMLLAWPYMKLISDQSELNGLTGIFVIAPSILFCCIMSTYRGYYEGLRNMTPTAVSQVIEALGKLILGFGLALLANKLGWSPENQAAMAIAGVTLGTLFGAIYLTLRFHISGDGIQKSWLAAPQPVRYPKTIFKMLAVIAIPVVIGSLANQVSSLVDAMTVQRRLADVVANNPDFFQTNYSGMYQELAKEASDQADLLSKIPTYLYGCYKGFAFSIFNLVPTIATSLGVSALPAMATAWAARSKKAVRLNMESVLRITSLIALPAGLGMTVLADGILNLLYPLKPVGAAIAAPNLAIMGFAAIFAGLALPITNMLQAIGKQNIPVRNIIVGAVIKIAINWIMVGIPKFNVHGASIGTVVCYFYIFIMNFYYLCKYTHIFPRLGKTFVKPLLAALFCAGAAWAASGLIGKVASEKLATVFAIVVAAVVYVLALILLRVLTKDDVLMLPKGEKIAKVLEKLHWIG